MDETKAGTAAGDWLVAYKVAGYVGIPGDRIYAWLRVMEMCGYTLSAKSGGEG